MDNGSLITLFMSWKVRYLLIDPKKDAVTTIYNLYSFLFCFLDILQMKQAMTALGGALQVAEAAQVSLQGLEKTVQDKVYFRTLSSVFYVLQVGTRE